MPGQTQEVKNEIELTVCLAHWDPTRLYVYVHTCTHTEKTTSFAVHSWILGCSTQSRPGAGKASNFAGNGKGCGSSSQPPPVRRPREKSQVRPGIGWRTGRELVGSASSYHTKPRKPVVSNPSRLPISRTEHKAEFPRVCASLIVRDSRNFSKVH